MYGAGFTPPLIEEKPGQPLIPDDDLVAECIMLMKTQSDQFPTANSVAHYLAPKAGGHGQLSSKALRLRRKILAKLEAINKKRP